MRNDLLYVYNKCMHKLILIKLQSWCALISLFLIQSLQMTAVLQWILIDFSILNYSIKIDAIFFFFHFSIEIARDAYHEQDGYEVVGGIISPVHDSYRKPDLVTGVHRCAMVKISLQSSDWIRLSDWECNEQTEWTRTRFSLQYHQVSRTMI